MAETYVDPRQLRFTQDSIASRFQNGGSIHKAVGAIRAGLLEPSDFPTLDVVEDDSGVLWSLDNRRLWVFQQAQVERLAVDVVARGTALAIAALTGRGRDPRILERGPFTVRLRVRGQDNDLTRFLHPELLHRPHKNRGTAAPELDLIPLELRVLAAMRFLEL